MTSTVENLAANIPSWGVKTAYGEKQTIDGTEVLPVALVSFGFGGGDGDEGSGAGGGGHAIPVGAYVGGPDGVAFRPNLIALLAVSIPLVWAGGHALARIVKALKK